MSIDCIELATGNTVRAKQAQHKGALMEEGHFPDFEENDWIVTPPVSFDGKQHRKVIKEEEFSSKYKRIGAPEGIDWAQYGWGK